MALTLNALSPAHGANRKPKRVGRGIGGGHGKTATRGYKGQKSRSGSSVRPGFEGGQMPLYRRLPKRGFHNLFRKEFAIVNLERLAEFEAGAKVDLETLREKGIINDPKDGLKILGSGELKHAIHVKTHRISKSALDKIQKAGGTVEMISKSIKTQA